MTRKQGGKEKKIVESSLGNGIENVQQNSVFGRYSHTEMVARLKEIARDPCKPQLSGENIQPLRNQVLRLRKVMVLQDSPVPWRKRKLEQFVNSTKEHFYKRTLLNSHGPSNLLTFENTLILDSNESVNCSNNAIAKSSSPHSSVRWRNIIGGHQQRKVIPVGPRFQVDIPELITLAEYNANSDNSKWLGTQICPIKIGNMKTNGGRNGKGRPHKCSCATPGSVDCVRCHVLEERLRLQCDLGPAFFIWKFDEMGEQVSKSWTLKEKENIESLVTRKKFCKNDALKCFPKKCWSDIVRYYFNVYVPQRMSMQTRSSPLDPIDTDEEDDDEEEVKYMGMRKRSDGKTLISNLGLVKARYLCRAS